MDKYIKSPLNYTGGKYKLLDSILPLFPTNITNFVDLFGGGFNVGINTNAKVLVYNDSLFQITRLLSELYRRDIDDVLEEIDFYIKKFNLSKINKEGYLELRKDYNSNPSSIKLYTLICFAFNNQIRFNKKGEYNVPFGKDRSSFNPTLEQRFIRFVTELQKREVYFYSEDFGYFLNLLSTLRDDSFIYCDPPYLNSVATYNENGGWTQEKEKELLNYLDILSEKNYKWALSNNLKYKNPFLLDWIKKYNIHYLNANYSNCNYQKKDKNKDEEILVTNY